MKFTLRTLFTLMSAVAFYLAIVFATPVPVRLVAVVTLSCLGGTAFITGAIYGHGYGRTFWIGCLATAIIPYLYIAYLFFQHGALLINPGSVRPSFSDSQIAYPLVACHVLILSSGFTAVAVRWLLIDSRGCRNAISLSTSSTTTEPADSRS